MEAAIDLEEAAKTIWQAFVKEHGLTFEEGPMQAVDQHGTPYVTLMCGGVRKDGGEYPTTCVNFTPDCLMMYFCTSLMDWLNGRTHIVWRTEPYSFDWVEDKTERQCSQMRCRLTAYKVKP